MLMVSSAIWFRTVEESSPILVLSSLLPDSNAERVRVLRPMITIMKVTVMSNSDRKNTVNSFFLIELGFLLLPFFSMAVI